jgi:hypothetical protein
MGNVQKENTCTKDVKARLVGSKGKYHPETSVIRVMDGRAFVIDR